MSTKNILPNNQQYASSNYDISNKPMNSLSTLTNYCSTSSPLQNPNINFSRFKTFQITQKIKQKLEMKNSDKCRRNQSLGNVFSKDSINPQDIQHNNLQNSYFSRNKQDQSINTNQKKIKKLLSTQLNNTTNKNKFLGGSTPKLDMTLPEIKVKKSHHINTTKANYLQIWLDQALDPQDIAQKQVKNKTKQQIQRQRIKNELLDQKKVDNSFLSTVKKYKIDKQFLKSQNIPPEIIQRLYNTLYIYTHGINNIFTELLSFVKGSSPQQPRDVKILDNFWKSFIKLLEGCTSFQTTFQKIQQTHLLKISQLKDFIARREQAHYEQKMHHNEVISKLEKRILQMNSQHSKLQSQHRVTVSTLQLTDQAFNQQVQLRLKFQQKVNHVYTSYQQLKTKYFNMMATLNIKNQQSISQSNIQNQLNTKIRQLTCKLQEVQHQLSQQKTKVRQRQEEVHVKKQQFLDLQEIFQLKVAKQQQEIDMIEMETNKMNMLKIKIQSAQARISLLESSNKQLKQKLKRQNQITENYRNLNQQLHEKYNQMGKRIANYEAQKIYQQNEISRLTAELTITKDKLQISEQLCSNAQTKIQSLTEQLNNTKYQVETKMQAISKINMTIDQLRATKDKYQRLFKIIQHQKQVLQLQKNKINQKYALEQQEIIGLKMLHQNREKYIKQIEVKHDKDKQILKRKITGYNEMLTKKQSLILNYQKVQHEKDNTILQKSYRIQNLQIQLTNQKAQHQRVKKQSQFLFKKLQQSQKQILKLKEQIKGKCRELELKHTEYDLSQQELSAVKNLLELVKSEQNSSIVNITTLYEQYRRQINRKGQHIHPMVFQDLLLQFNRAILETIPSLEKKFKDSYTLNDQLKAQIIKQNDLINKKTQTIKQLQAQITTKHHQILTQSQNINQLSNKTSLLNKQINQKTSIIEKQTLSLDQKQQTITKIKIQFQSIKKQNQQSEAKISVKDFQIQKLTANLNIVSDKLINLENQVQARQKNNPYVVKIEKLEKEVQGLMIQVGKFKNIVKVQEEIQTNPEPNSQVIIAKGNPSKFNRTGKFINQKSQNKFIDKEVQTALAPFDSIPHYIDHKITQINNSEQPKIIEQKSPNKNDSLPKVIDTKGPTTRRQQLRKALRITYMRR